MKGFIYNAAGLSIPVEFTPGVPFRFECPEEDCGKSVVIEGVVEEVNEAEFTRVLEATIRENPAFGKIREITSRRFVFRGKVNGKEVALPVESFQDFTERFLKEVLILKG
ncbi:hypothetical protein [Thermococcus stetteri]|uniref:hypothetical protein n=1 Tax=Thermococcus stetteri TaxID=49900 RepID=UPI001AEB2AAF|nr:hypothetical protein [Thermococcus stetteri]MBP1911926.1 hypothetical protein [Thermococcus stetteri]